MNAKLLGLWDLLKDLVRLKKKKQIFIKIVLKYVLTLGFPDSSIVKESACNAGDLGSIAGLGRSPGEGKSYPLQYSSLKKSMDRGTWQATVLGVAELDTN